METAEEKRLREAHEGTHLWRRWGPYLSERQWGTVREDYSENGDAWEYFPHEHARSRAYRWGEDGLAGISDDTQQLCFALSLWNGKDLILKERLFGLTGPQGNHGEDVKEYYFYLDNLPSHSYMKYLYKYPHQAYPYEDLIETNKRRSRLEEEYELLDTGIFDGNRYFDIFVEYAKVSSEDMLIKITIANQGPDPAELHLLPTLWFRNTWSWKPSSIKPTIILDNKTDRFSQLKASHSSLGDRWLYCQSDAIFLFTENETNQAKIFKTPNASPYVKDGINDYVIHGQKKAVNEENIGTKVAVYHPLKIGAGETKTIHLRLSEHNDIKEPFGNAFASLFQQRIKEADAFYHKVTPFALSDDMRNIQRQAFAGLLWNKQLYHYNVETWLEGDEIPPPESRKKGRNARWWNLDAYEIFSMPDKWEYPWFAAWDLAFHTISLALIDPSFAKSQLHLLVREWFMYPDGAIPAYEWSFSDVNPPVHAWAAMHIYQIEFKIYGRKDLDFLKKIFHKLMINFTWWVNRKDTEGRNIFEGGFLGLDNIGVFDRNKETPLGGHLEQCDGTAWMGMYCLNLLEIALELSIEDSSYEDMAIKFFEHFIDIADAMNSIGGQVDGLWDEKSGFYYGNLVLPDGKRLQLVNLDTIIGTIPLFATLVSDLVNLDHFLEYRKRLMWLLDNRRKRVTSIVDIDKTNEQAKILIALADKEKVRRILLKILDEKTFLSPFGIRSVSRDLKNHPFGIYLGEKKYELNYEPAESTTPLFGGNSNWRGPIWFPLNYLFIESLQKYHYFLGNSFKIEFPKDSKQIFTLGEISFDLIHRMINIFLKDEKGRRPVYGDVEKFQTDIHWRDYILFHEYFHGDNGKGLGASNQTGWTGLVAALIQQYGQYNTRPLA